MDFKLSCLLAIFAFAGTINATPSDEFVKKYITLDATTPQAILHLPPVSHDLDSTPKKCDFWVGFFNELSEEALPHHKGFGISIVPSNLQLAEGDSIDLMAHPMYHEGDPFHQHGESTSWDFTKNLSAGNLEFKPTLGWQDICINMTGRWSEKRSNATLVITLYFDQSEAGYTGTECPNGMTACGCAEERNRCIYTDLLCNGVGNCGAACGHDENTCSTGVSDGRSNEFVKKYITLDATTPQAIIHLPSVSHDLDATPKLCDYWISFFSELSQAALPHHKGFGISIVPSNLQLADGDSIDFMAHPMYYEEGGSHQHGERASWDSSKNLASANLEFKPIMGWQDICINVTGRWSERRSSATLVATLYFDQSEASYTGTDCPNGMTACGCAAEQNRCIYTDLLCNGVRNCGAACGHDESTCSTGVSDGRSNEFVKKYITLDATTPQAILHLPPVSHNLDSTTKLCDYWVSFFNDLPQAALSAHKAFGISIVPSNLQLAAGDSIDFMAHPMYFEDGGSHQHGERASWDSTKNYASGSLEFRPSLGWQDVCINLRGNWNERRSSATLIMTLYFDQAEAGYGRGECPNGMTMCGCSQEQNRCIYTDLVCNGVANCGATCGHDENTCSIIENPGTNVESSDWTSFEYLVMTSIFGLLLILVAGIFLMTMMYHRRTMALSRSSASTYGSSNILYPSDVKVKC